MSWPNYSTISHQRLARYKVYRYVLSVKLIVLLSCGTAIWLRNQEFELFIIVIIDGLEHFCQPNGWKLYTTNFEPKFFISVLTDETGRRFYCACLTFSEAISRQSLAGNANRGNYYAIYYPKTSTIRSSYNSVLQLHSNCFIFQ